MTRNNLRISPSNYKKSAQEDENNLRSQAVHMFGHVLLKGTAVRFFRSLTQNPMQLIDLQVFKKTISTANQHSTGIKSVSIDSILGSEGRVNDFDSAFAPIHKRSRGRWSNVAAAHLAGKALPPVELIQVGKTYFVRDGHHRISVAKAYGQKDIDAEVTKWEIQPRTKRSTTSPNVSINTIAG